MCKRAAIWAVARYLTRKVIERYLTVRKIQISSSSSGDASATPSSLHGALECIFGVLACALSFHPVSASDKRFPLQPYMKKLAAENPSLTLSKPSVQFDIVQRAARAVFAVIIVSRCILWMMRDHSAELAAEVRTQCWNGFSVAFDLPLSCFRIIACTLSPLLTSLLPSCPRDFSLIPTQYRKYGWPIPPRNSVYEGLGPAPLSARTICYDLFGWYLTVWKRLVSSDRDYGVVAGALSEGERAKDTFLEQSGASLPH